MKNAKIVFRMAGLLIVLLMSLSAVAQTSAANVAVSPSVVPNLVSFNGTLTDGHGKPVTGIVGVTFLLYKESQGGAPVWLETQNVTPDKSGHYTVQLGSTSSAGLSPALFVAGEPRWLAVQVVGEAEQPRVLLVAVPYAMKAADAETLGGLPPSAFALAVPPGNVQASVGPATSSVSSSTAAANAPASSNVTTTGGTIGALPLWSTSTNIQSSVLTQTGTGATAKIGLGTTTPAGTLDIKGTALVRGSLSLPNIANATSTSGSNSQPLNMVGSSFSSSTNAAVGQTFRWQVEPVANNTTNPSGSLNLLYGAGRSNVAETGLVIGSNGQITFAAGQTFPGTGKGTVTSVTAGTGLTGGNITTSGSLAIDTTAIPQLKTANTFTGSQTVNGNVSATGVVSASSYQIGSDLFAFGQNSNSNAYLGFAGNTSGTGIQNTGVGVGALSHLTTGAGNIAIGAGALSTETVGGGNIAVGIQAMSNADSGLQNIAIGQETLQANTGSNNIALGFQTLFSNSGSDNEAIGGFAMSANTTGGDNTAIGFVALENNTTGRQNTAVGEGAGEKHNGNLGTFLGYNTTASTSGLTNVTVVGASANVGESNALILGSTGSNAVSVGIGTSTPFNDYGLTVDATSNSTINGGVVVNSGGGNLYLGMTEGVHKFRVDVNGVTYADGGYQSSGADFAESVAVRGLRNEYEPGDVLEIDRKAHRGVALSSRPYATLVAGIYSTKPGLLATPHTIEDPSVKTSEVPLAIVGIVPCKVSTENGAIAPGDLLVTSSRPGYAMKGTDRRRMLGAVVGKALEPIAKGSGMIEVLVTLQ
ncbi:MAG TPA: hypothetical protein VMH04_06190 [Candidatus Solibacter sp.]|nr:hypothetical protein [Candidatus Solibacter sp.]